MMEEYELPIGWAKCTFGDIAFIRNGYAFKSVDFSKESRSGHSVPLIKQSQLGESVVEIKESVFLPDKYLKLYSDYIVAKGDILIGMSGSIGKKCIYNYDFPSLQNQRTGLIKLFSDKLIVPALLGYYLKIVENILIEKSKGVGVQNVSAKEIENIPLNLPPLAEQHRIVAKIEELFSSLDKGIESLQTARQQLKVYRQAVLKWAFEGLEKIEFDKIIQSTQNGISKRSADSGTDYKVLRLADVKNFCISDGESRSIRLSRSEVENYELVVDDLLCIRVNGSKDLVGSLVYVSHADASNKWCYCDHFIRIKLDRTQVLPKFINYFFKTALVRKYIHDNMVTSAGQNTVNQNTIRSILVPNADLGKQKQIIQEIESRLSVCDKIEESIDQSLQQAEALRQSILKKAFEGKLVPQDPNDEPASVLLERIKSERENSKLQKENKKRNTVMSDKKTKKQLAGKRNN